MTAIAEEDVGHRYADLMIEIRSRLREVEMQLTLADGEDSKRRLVFIAEYCYIQLRRIAELTALAILIAHNPHEEFRTNKLVTEWKPDKLLKMLGKLRPAAFPQNGIISRTPPNERVFIAASLPTTDVRDKICKIYTRCCDQLHVGALKSFLKSKSIYDFNEIDSFWRYLVDLLDEHVIYLPDGRMAYTKLGYPNADEVTVQWISLPDNE